LTFHIDYTSIIWLFHCSGCKGISYIPDITCKTKTSEKLNLLEAEVNTLHYRFNALKQNKQLQLENAKKEKKDN
jgi:hypothetical protein